MRFTHDIAAAVKPEERNRYHALLSEAENAAAALKAEVARGTLPIFSLARENADMAMIEEAAAGLRRFRTLLVLGTGGSSLGGQMFCALGGQQGWRTGFVDNIDPHTFGQLLELDFEDTAFLCISKSGETVETIAQAMLALDTAQKRLGRAKAAERFRFITAPQASPLRTLGEAAGVPVLPHDPRVGGRFSVFSLVGLIPAAVAGMDIRAIREGAAEVLEKGVSAAASGAALQVLWTEQGRNISVLMPYVDRLMPMARWWRQIWAESLGKQGKGSTPADALGPVDQHSQLQLYLGGPDDKGFTLLTLAPQPGEPLIASETARAAGVEYLAGGDLGKIMEAHARATRETLTAAGRPVRHMHLAALDERTIGALAMHFMLETVIAAALLGVNAYDQPAVEDGKRRAREYLAAMHKVVA